MNLKAKWAIKRRVIKDFKRYQKILRGQINDELFKKEAKQIRLKLNNEENLYLKGSHDDFMLKPNDGVIEKILDFFAD